METQFVVRSVYWWRGILRNGHSDRYKNTLRLSAFTSSAHTANSRRAARARPATRVPLSSATWQQQTAENFQFSSCSSIQFLGQLLHISTIKRLGYTQQINSRFINAISCHFIIYLLFCHFQINTHFEKVKEKPTWNETPQVLLLLLFSINDTAELSSSELDPGSLLSSTLKGSGAAPTARRVGTGRRLRAKSIGPVKIH